MLLLLLIVCSFAQFQEESAAARRPPASIPSSYSWTRGNREVREIAISFDDGPHPTRTPQLLDILRKYNVLATFFVQGKFVATPQGTEVLRRMASEGHEIGHHSWDHPQLSRETDAGLKHQIESTIVAIEKAIGRRPSTLRPPYGATNPVLNKRFLNEYGLKVVLWDVDPEDWKPGKTSQQIANHWATQAKNGSILLAHDIHQVTIDAMDSAISQLLARGFRFRTISGLLNLDSITTGVLQDRAARQ